MDLAELSLNSITVKGLRAESVADLAARHGFGGIALWRDTVDTEKIAATAAHIRDLGLRVTSLCRGGMFPQSTADATEAALADNRIAIDQAAALGAECLVLVCGAASGPDLAVAREQVRSAIAELEPYARTSGVPLAIEPMHPMMASNRSVITSIGEAGDLVRDIDSDYVGLALDSYHVWWDANLSREIERARGRILGVQLADWITPIEGELTSRGMPGEGCIDLGGFIRQCRRAGFDGLAEVEVLSSRWWAADAEDAMRAAIAGTDAIATS